MKLRFFLLFLLLSVNLWAQDMQQLIQPEVNNAQKQEAYRKAKVKTVEIAVTDPTQKNRTIQKDEIDKKGRTVHILQQDYADPVTGYPLYVFSDIFYGYGEGDDNLVDTIFDRPEDYMGRSWFGNEYYTWFTYNEKGQLMKRQHNLMTDEYFYNAEGHLTEIVILEGKDTFEHDHYTYTTESDSKVIKGNGFTIKFDASGRMVYRESSWQDMGAEASVFSYTYFYDGKGLLTKMETTENSMNKITIYTYDKKNLLQQVTIQDGKGSMLYTLEYRYTFY